MSESYKLGWRRCSALHSLLKRNDDAPDELVRMMMIGTWRMTTRMRISLKGDTKVLQLYSPLVWACRFVGRWTLHGDRKMQLRRRSTLVESLSLRQLSFRRGSSKLPLKHPLGRTTSGFCVNYNRTELCGLCARTDVLTVSSPNQSLSSAHELSREVWSIVL